jgi:hypothetical protein
MLQPTGLYRSQVSRETDKAVCIDISERVGGGQLYSRDNGRVVWFPKSRIEWRATQYGEELHAPAWLIRDKL